MRPSRGWQGRVGLPKQSRETMSISDRPEALASLLFDTRVPHMPISTRSSIGTVQQVNTWPSAGLTSGLRV